MDKEKLLTVAKIWAKRLGLLLALPVGGVLVLAVYISVKIATYEQTDNA